MTFNSGKLIFAAILAAAIALPCGIASAADSEKASILLADRKERPHKMENWQKREEKHKKFSKKDSRNGNRRDFEKYDGRNRPERDQFGNRPGDHFNGPDHGRPGQMGRPEGMRPGEHRPNGPGFPGNQNGPGHNPVHNPGNMRPDGHGIPGMNPGNRPMPPHGMNPGDPLMAPQGMHPGAR